ncbi:NUMOD3 domain-containing DNA-binding protein [Vibrio sp. ER1A]|uniref:NUMOD3 domain-containing DNA-binding protein n=1 Tax=Vibrio sp. ER1A TaxID=1517681 RepID=UPI0004DCDA21|nr:NUMOD3 domain-containing DNA-binding protein [Vibrio sp. ER1A]KFA99261.1 hypothetical protein HW45_04885 [Vibrio sp. ER1A]
MNIQQIKQEILSRFPNAEETYLDKYLEICSKDDTTDYVEAHHILPKSKSLWPEYISFKSNPWNKVKLSYVNHCLAHLYIAKSINHFAAWTPVQRMIYGTNENSMKYRNITEEDVMVIAKCAEEYKTHYRGDIHHNTGLKRNVGDEARRKISLALKGKKKPERTEGHKQNLTSSIRKRYETYVVSQETREKLSSSIKKYYSENKRILSSAHKKAISDGMKGENHMYFGKTFSNEHKSKISESNKITKRNNQPHWKFYDELFEKYVQWQPITHSTFRTKVVKLGYPDKFYGNMIKSFETEKLA